MSHAANTEVTEAIVASVLSLYANDGDKMHFRFADTCMSLATLLRLIIPCIGAINWPLDKEEVGRLWHFLYLLYDRVAGLAMDDCMPHGSTRPASEEVILHPYYMSATLNKLAGRFQPFLASLHLHPQAGIQVAPASEIRLIGFKSLWFLSSESYVKRIRVLKDATITTLFIAKSHTWNNKTRYTLTWLPHTHLRAKIVQKRYTGSWGCVSSPTKNFWKLPPNPKKIPVELTALVFNVREAHYSHLAPTLYSLIGTEKPKMLIVTGTGMNDAMVANIANSLGYNQIITNNSSAGLVNGFMVIWNPLELTIEGQVSYDDTKHLRIQATKQEHKSKLKKMINMVFN